jgi:hypothetical protein
MLTRLPRTMVSTAVVADGDALGEGEEVADAAWES